MISVATPVATIKWVKPAPLWDPQDAGIAKPFLAEFDNDRFLPEFLDLMGGKLPGKTPADLAGYQAKSTDGKLKLYQPLHGKYYLVTGSLVCRQLGLPDRSVVRKNGEKVSFVLRKLVLTTVGHGQQYVEYGWVDAGPNKGWQPLLDDNSKPVAIRKDEQRLPVHPVNTCISGQSGSGVSACNQRTVYHGYIPADSREKYLTPAAAQSIQDLIDNQPPPPPGVAPIADPRLDEVTTRVIEAWRALYIYNDYSTNPPTEKNLPVPTDNIKQQNSLNIIVDLGIFLNNNLSSVFNAIINGTNLPNTSNNTKRQALLDELRNISNVTLNTTTITLANAISRLSNSANLALAESEPPTDTYNLYNASKPGGGNVDGNYLAPPPPPHPPIGAPGEGQFHMRFGDALDEQKTDNPQSWLNLPGEIGDMIKDEPASGDLYYLRLVYEHDPCDPVVSDPSERFTFAKIFDPDAPARHIRIELPSMKLKDLRKYKRGVGMQMSPELGDVVNKVNPGMLTGGGLLDTGSTLGIAMICSFSIPIITLCALIVMFIFLILLNIIFWWLPFIRICFPIPKPK